MKRGLLIGQGKSFASRFLVSLTENATQTCEMSDEPVGALCEIDEIEKVQQQAGNLQVLYVGSREQWIGEGKFWTPARSTMCSGPCAKDSQRTDDDTLLSLLYFALTMRRGFAWYQHAFSGRTLCFVCVDL
jgi:hypothetical protein